MATISTDLGDHIIHYLLTLDHCQGVTPGQFGRILYGKPKDKLSKWGRLGAKALRRLGDLGLAEFQERITKGEDYIGDGEEKPGSTYTGRTSIWITTHNGERLATAIRHHHRLAGTTPPSLPEPLANPLPIDEPNGDAQPDHPDPETGDGGLPVGGSPPSPDYGEEGVAGGVGPEHLDFGSSPFPPGT